jgi:hypothetical protein
VLLVTWHVAHVEGSLFGNVGPGGGPACGCGELTNASVSAACMLWHVVQRGWRNLPASDWLNARRSTSCAEIAATKTSSAVFVSVTVSRLSGVPAPSLLSARAAVVKASRMTSRCGVAPIAGTTTPATAGSTTGEVGARPMSSPSGRLVLAVVDVDVVGRLLPSPEEQLAIQVANATIETAVSERAFMMCEWRRRRGAE